MICPRYIGKLLATLETNKKKIYAAFHKVVKITYHSHVKAHYVVSNRY